MAARRNAPSSPPAARAPDELPGRARRRLRIWLGLALACFVSAVWGFIELAEEVLEQETRSVDAWILRSLRVEGHLAELRGPVWVADSVRDITALGSSAVLLLIVVIAVGYLWLRGRRGYASLVVGATVSGALLYSALKLFFRRERPFEVPALAVESSASFPSGHSTMAAIVYLSLAVVLAYRERSRRLRLFVLGAGASVTVLVGASRVALGVHYPSDVLAGWCLGVAWASIFWVLLLWLGPGPYAISPDARMGGAAQAEASRTTDLGESDGRPL